MRLRHIHLPSSPSLGLYPAYTLASRVQESFRRYLLDAKEESSRSSSSSSSRAPSPPTLLSFTPAPTFTLGRRLAVAHLSPDAAARLIAPLRVIATTTTPSPDAPAAASISSTSFTYAPAILDSPRGGLATYHGPGQVVLWPVLDLKSRTNANFTVRSYACLLEKTTIAVLARLYGLRGFTTDDPGVWVRSSPPPPRDGNRLSRESGSGGAAAGESRPEAVLRKISALGVHLRRHVSALGTAVNLDMPTTWGAGPVPGADASAVTNDDDAATNPWSRFVACGLEGKGVTSVAAELALLEAASYPSSPGGPTGQSGRGAAAQTETGTGTLGSTDPETFAAAWAEELAGRLGVDGVERVGDEELARLIRSEGTYA